MSIGPEVMKAFMLSLPFAFLIAAVLFANEVPDYETDALADKHNWVSITRPQKAYLLYSALVMCAYVSQVIACVLKLISPISLISLAGIVFTAKSTMLLRYHYQDKDILLKSSKLSIALHMYIGISIILGIVL